KVFGAAQEVVARFRIPHHADVSQWLDLIAVCQMVWIAVGLFLARRTALFAPLAVLGGAGAALTVLQVVTGNDTLALLFPWRMSIILVPVATAVILTRLAEAIEGWLAKRR